MGTVFGDPPLSKDHIWSRPEFSSLSILREACELIREVPPSLWQRHFLGAVPAMAGTTYFALFFSTEQSRSSSLFMGALGMTLLFFWLKGWQCAFAIGLLELRQKNDSSRTLLKWLGIFAHQGALQAWGLFLIPLAGLTFFPLIWVLAYFQSLTVYGDLPPTQAKQAAFRQVMSGHVQMHFLFSWLMLITLLTFLNVLSFGITLPWLIKILFGLDSLFTRGGVSTFLNFNFFLVIIMGHYRSFV